MFGLAIIAAAVSLVGAPSTPIRCNPDLPPGIQGRTYFGGPQASLIEMGPTACAGLLLLSVSPIELQEIVALNPPSLNVAMDEGVAIQVLLMEEEHTSHPYSGPDETDDLCRANAVLPSFLSRYLSGDALAAALRWAAIYTAAEPPATYHTHACS